MPDTNSRSGPCSGSDLRAWLPAAPADWDLKIVRKPVRHIYFRIYPGQRQVKISVPLQISRRELSAAVRAKAGWLLKKISETARMTRTCADEQGRCRFKGRAYRLTFRQADGPPRVVFDPKVGIDVRTRPGTSSEKQSALIEDWLRHRLREEIQGLLEKWEPAMGVKAAEFRIRRMKTRWGSCNTRAGRIWINFSLIRLAPDLLEYVLVHELAHLLEPSHNLRFYSILDRHLPGWKASKAELDRYSPV